MSKRFDNYYIKNIISIFSSKHYEGWGRKKTGRFASWCKKNVGGTFTLFEDGFIRSVGLGIDGSPSFSLVKDTVGIYYDATAPSELEILLNSYDFSDDNILMSEAYEAIELIKKYNISKYNNTQNIDEKHPWISVSDHIERVLVISQTASDASLEYGLAGKVNTKEIIEDAIRENPKALVYLKIHPDVLAGKKKSDINLEDIPKKCILIDEDINSIFLLKYMDKVYTKTSNMGMEALLLKKTVVCYGLPYYSGWGLTIDKQSCLRRTRQLTVEELFAGAYIKYTHYFNPYSQKKSDIFDTIYSIVKYREIYKENEGSLYFFGFSIWKRQFTTSFFTKLKNNNIIFCTNLNDALKKGLNQNSKVYIWGKKSFPEVEQYIKNKNILLYRVEDGFIRSTFLGSDLIKAYSLVVDSRGIYFDPTQESRLEDLLNTYTFDSSILDRAQKLQDYLIKNKISKYNIYKDDELKLNGVKRKQKIIMVPGQVEDDASIIWGANGMTNLELLQATRKNACDAYIIYKPHPDVIVGNRKGSIAKEEALKYCNIIIEEASIDSVFEKVDEIHTMTSLVGFEALMRGKKVTTYGLPFYAGWGLTRDIKFTSRRNIKRTIEELIAATLILYPRYIHPKTNIFCEVEVLLSEIEKERRQYNNKKLYRILINSRNFVSRKIQFIIKRLLGK